MKCVIAIDDAKFHRDQVETLTEIIGDRFGDVQFIEHDPRTLTKMPNSIDLCVVDFGGGCSGYGEERGSMYCRELIKAIEDRPGTLFLVWSTHSVMWYRDVMLDILERELGKQLNEDAFKCPANVMLYPKDYDQDPVWSAADVWLSSAK